MVLLLCLVCHLFWLLQNTKKYHVLVLMVRLVSYFLWNILLFQSSNLGLLRFGCQLRIRFFFCCLWMFPLFFYLLALYLWFLLCCLMLPLLLCKWLGTLSNALFWSISCAKGAGFICPFCRTFYVHKCLMMPSRF